MMKWVRLVTGAVLWGMIAGCASGPGPSSEGSSGQSAGAPVLKTQDEIVHALDRAQQAFIEGDWGAAVVSSNQVMEGAATPEQYYEAVKILGLASCNRKDARPVEFSWTRLNPTDRESLRTQCEKHGLQISDDGKVEANGL